MTMTEAWCRTYTRMIPPDEADRRRQEITSHVQDALQDGVPRARLLVETALGADADVTWSAAERRRHGLVPLWLVPFVDASVGAIIGGVLILLTLGWAIVGPEGATKGDWAGLVLGYCALVLAGSGHVWNAACRLRR
jgi:hypothetical protein